MERISAFLEMGGYAGYVWPAYGITAIVLVGLLIMSLRQLRDRESGLGALESLRPRRRRGGEAEDPS